MPWETVLTDLTGVPISELAGANNKRVAMPVCSMATAAAQVRLDHDDADTLLECDTLLKVYERLSDEEAAAAVAAGTTVAGDGRVLHFVGRQTTADETAGSGFASVAATWADAFWILMGRLCGKTVVGFSRGTALSPVDPSVIIAQLVDETIVEAPMEVRMGNVGNSTATYVENWLFKPIGEAIAELSATLFGPDWRVRPIEPVMGAGPVAIHGELDVLPVIGADRPDAIYEYGDGLLNVASYRRAVTMDGFMNRGWSLPPGFPDNAVQVPFVRENTASQARHGRVERVVAQDLTVDDLRAKLLDHHIAIRSEPRQTITFEPVRDLGGDRVPRLGIDVNVGDIITFRASVNRRGVLTKRVDARMRCYQYAVTVDNEGNAQIALTVTPS